MAENLKFVDSHNNAAYVSDPPKPHKEFQSMVAGLRTCKIAHALTANPAICKDLIADFWLNASFRIATADAPELIISRVQGKEICISEQIIRDVLKIEDSASSPSDLPLADVVGVLKRMGYEESFPPTVKKRLPPYWRFLFHTFVICLSGRKGGADEISAASTSAIAALTMDWDFNFSRFIFNEMRSNLSSKKKDVFAMYPRFLQLIFDAIHPELVRSNNSYDIKALGPNTFGLMKQVRKSAKEVFKGTEALVKFGKFAEIEGVAPPPTAMVAEEHVPPPKPNLQFAFEISDSDDEDVVDDDVLDEFDIDTSKSQEVPTDEEIRALAAKLDETARKPPPTVPVITEPPRSESEPELSPLTRKRKKRDPRPGVLITEATTTPTPTVTPTQEIPEPVSQDPDAPIIEEQVSDEEMIIPGESTHASGSGSSSAQGPTGGDPHLEASIRLAQHLASQDSVRQSSQTGIHIGAGKGKETAKDSDQIISELQEEVFALKQQLVEKDILIGNLDVKVSELEKEKSEHTRQISELQANLGGLTAIVFDMKYKLFQKFGDEFGTAATSSTRTPETVVVTPAPDVTLQQYMSSGPATAEERREKNRRISKLKKGKTLVKRTSDQNAPGDAPQMFFTDLEKKRFADKYGDRSGILMWGYEADKKAWVVKRKSGNIEYYEKNTDFMSWTRVDLSELLNAPFHNPSNERKAWDFKKFLEFQAKKKFDGLTLPSSFTKKVKDVIDPRTEKTMVNVMWPATKKMKKIPVSRPIPDGSLDTMEFWVYDEDTSTVVIKLKKNQIRLVDPRDLLKFGERDIQTLSRQQLLVNHDIFEDASKVFTSMVAKIINNRLWAGALAARSDVELVDL